MAGRTVSRGFAAHLDGPARHWCWNDAEQDHYWVPGTWVQAPEPGLLWTPGYGGRGFDGDLMREALNAARCNGWRVVPACSYAAAYIRKRSS